MMICQFFRKIKDHFCHFLSKPEHWTAFFTLALVIVTASLAFETHEMAEVMHETFVTNNRPYLFVENAQIKQHESFGHKMSLPIRNVGTLPAQFKVKTLKLYLISFNGTRPQEIDLSSKMIKRLYNIYPEQKNGAFEVSVSEHISQIEKSDWIVIYAEIHYSEFNKNIEKYNYTVTMNYDFSDSVYDIQHSYEHENITNVVVR